MVRLSLLALSAAGVVSAQKFDLEVNTTSGAFQINLDGNPFLAGSEVVANFLSASAGELTQTAPSSTSSGTDAFGEFHATTFSWGSANAHKATVVTADTLMTTTFKTYSSDEGLIVFEQHFPNEINVTTDSRKSKLLRDNFDGCRIVTEASVSLTDSEQGYSAFTPSTSKPGTFDKHSGKYCDDNHEWAFTGNLDQAACQSKCEDLKCTCFDVKSAASQSYAQTVFPGFSRKSPSGKDLDVFAYHGVFPSLLEAKLSIFEPTAEGGAPIVIFDADNAEELPMVVFSPVNFPKAQHVTATAEYFGAGVKAKVLVTPAGWTQTYMLSAGHGINAGMMAWGDRMLTFTGKKRADMYLDQTHSTIGFWTDNGGYYHYSTGTNKSATYEEVLPKVKAYHDALGVPFGHWQFDSWFYPKDGGVGPGGGGGAVTNWTALPSVFPSGMANIQSQLGAGMPNGMPTIMHNRQWSTQSDYIKNLPQFEWYTSKYAIPKDPEAFFDWFFQQQEGWGLSMYEQDWMCTEYDGVDALNNNISMGDLWLAGMAAGAAKSGRTVQYCMPYPYDLLHAAAEPAVTNARATGDYFHSTDQWSVPNTAMFYWAIGVLPFKDGFYSSNLPQIGGQTVGPETSPDREIIMATLSCAMVGPMDGIELLNKTRVMASCRGDGTVLKPDRPVMTSDACFAARDSLCHISHTYSEVEQLNATVHYVFSSSATKLSDRHFDLDATTNSHIIYNWYTRTSQPLAASMELEAGYEGHVYAIAAPITGAFAFVGEPDKYTTAARIARFSHGVTYDASSKTLTAQVQGTANETVTVCAVEVASLELACKSAHFDAAGTQAIAFN